MVQYYIGTSGWHYADWKSKFYPDKLKESDWLKYYSEHFDAVEINSSFYHLPREKTLINWRNTTKDKFKFCLKASRFITHIKKLKDCQNANQTFLQLSKLLGQKAGIILYQLPNSLHIDIFTLKSFIEDLPGSIAFAFEFRHPSWFSQEVYSILSQYNICCCIYDMPEFTSPIIQTADFIYIRFHGSSSLYTSKYTSQELKQWSRKIKKISENAREVYIFFNNDYNAFAVDNAKQISEMLIT